MMEKKTVKCQTKLALKKKDSSFISETAFDQHSMYIFMCGNLLRFCFVPTTLLSLFCRCHILDIDMENESACSHR